MASGLVPITSDGGAVSEVVDHECGILTDGESFTQLADAVEVLERQLISTTLERTGGNISETARVLGLTRRGLHLKMRRLGLESIAAGF